MYLSVSKKYNLEEEKVKETIEKLLKEGYIYESGDKKYKAV